ncbi:protein lin-37 homolog, partial [Trematomus bernacchii]|uniref:protein lin-37 homolog n=1 Tax=Trematomus bernacchii TaxID=40690 RepID=UPI00146DD50D
YAWMRNNPSVRVPPASPSPPHSMVEDEECCALLPVPSGKYNFSEHLKWKECSNKNQLRYSESIKVLKEMKELYDR